MAFAPDKIHLGACRLFAGVTPATSGQPPTYTTHTDGVPATGTDLGLTQGDTLFSFDMETKLIESENALGYVNSFTISQRASIEATLMEQTYISLQMAFANVFKENPVGGIGFAWGGGTAALTPATTCIMLTARQPKAPTKFIIVQLYKAAVIGSYKIPFSRKNESVYRVKFEALEDATRTAGDYAGYYRVEA